MEERQGNKRTPLSVFISYAHEDEPLRQQLEDHLSLLRRQGLISEWHDREILPGAEWAQEIDEHLLAASIILLLISADFLASDYCFDIEMQRALERHQRAEARVIPIILRPCDWQTSPFAPLQSLPNDGKAVTTWQNPDEAFLAIVQGLRRVIEQQQIPLRPLPEVEQKNRRSLIKRVRTTWIEGLLEHSLHEAVRLELHLEERPDMLANPWILQVQELDRAPEPLPAGTSIVQVYDEAGGELLILGEPGAGKTTLLLELARELLERAEQEKHHRLPVIFNLSSWATKCGTLADWLVEELWTKYQVLHKIGQAWIDADQILPLLDGLDEMAEHARPACVQAINSYRQHHLQKQGTVPLVVCCRSQEYSTLTTRVMIQQAVSIQPLTDEQIERYLQSTQGQLEGLQYALRTDQNLSELARRPLVLNIFSLAYQGVAPEDFSTEGAREIQQRQVFATYVERMLSRRGVHSGYPRAQVLPWLAWLAQQLVKNNLSEFYPEGMQRDWLGEPQTRWRWLFALFFGLFGALSFGLSAAGVGYFGYGMRGGLLFGICVGLVSGVSVVRAWLHFRQPIGIHPTGVWNLSVARRFLRREGLLFMLLGVLVVGSSGWFFIEFLGGAIFEKIGFGLVYGLIGGCIGWQIWYTIRYRFHSSTFEEEEELITSTGFGVIDQSGRFGIFIGLFFGFLFGLGFGLIAGLLPGLLVGLGAGLYFGYRFGGGVYLHHHLLRILLWRNRSIPWNFVAFLDEATERLLLRKIGGRYIFIHRLLLDYFASLEKKES